MNYYLKKYTLNLIWLAAHLAVWYAAAVFASGIFSSYYQANVVAFLINCIVGALWWFIIVRKGVPYLDNKLRAKKNIKVDMP